MLSKVWTNMKKCVKQRSMTCQTKYDISNVIGKSVVKYRYIFVMKLLHYAVLNKPVKQLKLACIYKYMIKCRKVCV